MGLFEIFKQQIFNAESAVEGKLYNVTASGEVLATDILQSDFDGWNGTVYADTNESDIPVLDILGFNRFKNGSVLNAVVGRAILGVPQKTKIKVSGSVADGSVATVKIKLKTSNFESEFAKYHPQYYVEKRYQITFNDTLNAAEFYTKLKSAVDKDDELGVKNYMVASLLNNANAIVTSAPTGILLETTSATLDFEVYLTLPSGMSLTFIADTPALDTNSAAGGGAGANVVQESYEGRNTYEQLRHIKLETDAVMYPYSEAVQFLPQKGAKYVSFYIETKSNDTRVGQSIVDQQPTPAVHRFFLYLREDACGFAINNISRWLEANADSFTAFDGTVPADVDSSITANPAGGLV